MLITNDKIVSRDNKQTILQGANVKRTTQSTSKEDTITSKYWILKENASFFYHNNTICLNQQLYNNRCYKNPFGRYWKMHIKIMPY